MNFVQAIRRVLPRKNKRGTMTDTQVNDLPTSTPEERKAFKEAMFSAIHATGSKLGLCEQFDRILIEGGIPPRPTYEPAALRDLCTPEAKCGTCDAARKQRDREMALINVPVEGEETQEEFDAWREKVSLFMLDKAKQHGYAVDSIERYFRPAGLYTHADLFEVRKVQFKGEFVVDMELSVRKGADLIDSIGNAERAAVGQSLQSLMRSNEANNGLTWKVTLAD